METSAIHLDDREAAIHTILQKIDEALHPVIEYTKTPGFDASTAVTLLTQFGAIYRSEGRRLPMILSEMLPTTPSGPRDALDSTP